ncbi:hypothetical protein Tco_0411606 [Tanacetum coccineum]
MVIEGEVLNDLPRFVDALIGQFTAPVVWPGSERIPALSRKSIDAKTHIDDEGLFWSSLFPVERIEQGNAYLRFLLCGDRDHDGKTLQASILHQPDGVGSKRHHLVPFGEFNGVPIALVASNKSSDEIDEDATTNDAAGEKPVQKPASENGQALKNVLDKMMDQEKEVKEQSDVVRKEFEAQCNRHNLLGKTTRASSTNSFNTVSTPVNTAGASRIFGDVGSSFVPLSKFTNLPHDPLMPDLEDTAEVPNTSIFGSAYDDDLDTCNSPYADQVMGAKADFNNMEPSTVVSPIPTTRVHSIHPKDQIIGDPRSTVQTRGMIKKSSGEHVMISYIQKQRRSNHKDFQNYLFAYFLSQQEPTKIAQALDDESWVEAMQEELLQFKIQKVWTLVDLLNARKAIRHKVGMNIKSAFLYGTIEEEDKYVGEILKKFGFSSIRTTSTPMETNKALAKDKEGEDVDVHLYRYLKGRPKLGLWYPKDSPFILEAFSDSDYAGASLDRKSTTGGCQFLGSRLISGTW